MSESFWLMSRYRVKKENLAEFLKLAKEHHPVAHAAGLATSAPSQLWVANEDGEGSPEVVEIFEWVSGDALDSAHEHPEIARIWGAMRPLFVNDGDEPPREHMKLRPV